MKSIEKAARRSVAEHKTRREFLKDSSTLAASVIGAGIASWPAGVLAQAANDPIWQAIPDQTWAVGVPVNFDLADYATSQIGAELLFTLDNALPDGVSLNGSVVSGTPTGTFASSAFIATAEDGQIIQQTTPENPTDMVAD